MKRSVMKLTKTAAGYKLAMSYEEWVAIGEKMGWLEPETPETNTPEPEPTQDELDDDADFQRSMDIINATHPKPRRFFF